MALSLVGSKVLITGATSGIGRETAKLLAQSGCVVAITGRRQERLEELESEIKGFGGKVFSQRISSMVLIFASTMLGCYLQGHLKMPLLKSLIEC